jgi:hypothetical protein
MPASRRHIVPIHQRVSFCRVLSFLRYGPPPCVRVLVVNDFRTHPQIARLCTRRLSSCSICVNVYSRTHASCIFARNKSEFPSTTTCPLIVFVCVFALFVSVLLKPLQLSNAVNPLILTHGLQETRPNHSQSVDSVVQMFETDS